MLWTAASACSRVSTPLKMTPISPMSSACLTTQAPSSASGGKRAKSATFGATLPFFTAAALSIIPMLNMWSPAMSSGVCSMST